MKVKSIEDLKSVILDRWNQLNELTPDYLSDTGKAAKEAYRAVYWHCSFHDSIKTLSEDEDFMNLVNIPDKNPEFYKLIRRVYRAVEQLAKLEEGD